MPLIQVFATENTVTKSEQDVLMTRISKAVLKAEGAPVDHDGALSLVWAYFNEQPTGSLYVGGTNLDKSPLRIAVTTPQGALSADARTSLVAEIGEIVDDIVGLYEERLNQWTMLYELDEGSWAGSGQIFPLAGIQDAMGIKAA